MWRLCLLLYLVDNVAPRVGDVRERQVYDAVGVGEGVGASCWALGVKLDGFLRKGGIGF